MRNYFVRSIWMITAALVMSTCALAQGGEQQAGKAKAPAAPSGPAPVRDLSGVWLTSGGPGGEGPGGEQPPYTPWAQAKYDANKPGYGPKAAPGGNDPDFCSAIPWDFRASCTFYCHWNSRTSMAAW